MGPLLVVVDQKSAGTQGGGVTAGSWVTRDLNTKLVDKISGASLSANQVTLPTGTYYVSWTAPAYDVNYHKSRLRNITNNTTLIIGSSEYTLRGGGSAFSTFATLRSSGFGEFTLTASSTLELQHRVSLSSTPSGLGVACNFDEDEIYSQIAFEKV